MASARSSAQRYNLSAPAWGCASLHRRSATSTSSATHPPELSARWCPGTFGDRFSNISTEPPILAGGRPAPSSPPGTFGRVSPQMSMPGRSLSGLPAGQGPPPCTGIPTTHPGTNPQFQPHPRGPGGPPASLQGVHPPVHYLGQNISLA